MQTFLSSVLVGTMAILLLSTSAAAQINSSETSTSLTAVLPESLTVTLLPAAVTFTLVGGSPTNAGSATISATTSWTLSVDRTTLALYGYFSNSSGALVHTALTNTVDIPSSRVEASINGGAAAALNQTVAFGAASGGRQIFSQNLTVPTASGTRVDTLALNINLAGLSLPADTYTGTLRLRAQAAP